VLWEVATGRQVTRWPVDARGMLACGEYTTTPPDGVQPDIPAPPPAAVTAPAPPVPGMSTAADASPGRPMEVKRTRGKLAE
jgi:hypothetical protein